MNKTAHERVFYGYSSPTDGTITVDGEVIKGSVDFRTTDRYIEYREVGFNVLLLQRNDPYNGEDFDTSQLKKNMNSAFEAGITKIVVTDERIYNLSSKESSLIGDDKEFKSKKDLDFYIANCVKDYSKHPCFYGLMLRDEPHASMFLAIKEVQESILRVIPNCFIQCNLLPSLECAHNFYVSPFKPLNESYKDYLETFFSMMPQTNVSFDSYPYLIKNGEFVYEENHLNTLKIFCDTAKKYKKDTTFVVQSCEMDLKGKSHFRQMSDACLKLDFNLSIAFGTRGLAYFTYWRKQFNSHDGEFFKDNSSFITTNGDKTRIYFAVQKLFRSNEETFIKLDKYRYHSSSIIDGSNIKTIIEKVSIISKNKLLITSLRNNNKIINVLIPLGDPDASTKVDEITINNIDEYKIIKCEGEQLNLNKFNLKIGDALILERIRYEEK